MFCTPPRVPCGGGAGCSPALAPSSPGTLRLRRAVGWVESARARWGVFYGNVFFFGVFVSWLNTIKWVIFVLSWFLLGAAGMAGLVFL